MRNRLILTILGIVVLGFAAVPEMDAGQQPKLLNISASIVQFDPAGVGSTSVNHSSLNIYNPGTTPVTISGFSITGPYASDFSADPGFCPVSPASLSPGASCYPNVFFTPSAVGLRMAALVIRDIGGSPQTVLLAGQGLAATRAVGFSIPEVVFPDSAIGLPPQAAPMAYIQVLNTGNVAVNIQSVTVAGASSQDFQIIANYCNGTLIAVRNSCFLDVSFIPTTIGVRRARLQVFDDAPGGVQFLPLIGVGSPPVERLELFPVAVAFAPTGTAGAEGAQVTVENTGSEPVTINGFLITGENAADFSLVQNYCQPIPYTLPAQSQCSIQLQFTPGAIGPRFADLQVVDSAPGSPHTVPMEGTGVLSTISLSFNPAPLIFGLQTLGQTWFADAYLQNSGTGTAQVSLQIQGLDAADFSLSNYCPPLGPNGSCFVPLTFTPSLQGIRVAGLIATDSVSGQRQSVALIGSGVQPETALSVSTPIFPPEAVGSTGTANLNIGNQSQTPFTLTGLTLTGGAKSDFGILQNGCRAGLVLNPFAYCTVQLTFSPAATGTRIAGIDVSYSGGSPVSVPLAARGLPSSRTITFAGSELDFGAQGLGVSVGGSATINNTGNAAVTITSVSIRGVNAGDYAITGNQCPQSPATLGPGAGCQISVQFTASALGARFARLQVADNATGSPQNLPLIGFGSDSSPILQSSANALNFEPQALGSSTQQFIYLANVSDVPVSFSGFQILGRNAGDFTMANDCPATLSKGASCYVYVTFTPSVTGLRFAVLRIEDNATTSPQIIPMAGMGAKATRSISLSPIPLTFSLAQGIGYTTSATIWVTNSGTEDVLLTAFRLGGRDAADFGIQSNDCPLSPAPLQAHQSCLVTIAFTASAVGVRVANFSVTDNASGSPQSISVVGEGVVAAKILQVSPASVSFASTSVGSTDYDGGFVNIYNSGTVPVTFKSFSFTGANPGDFSIGSNFCLYGEAPALSPGANCQLYLNFTPSAAGTRTADLIIRSDAPPQKVQLTGTGL